MSKPLLFSDIISEREFSHKFMHIQEWVRSKPGRTEGEVRIELSWVRMPMTVTVIDGKRNPFFKMHAFAKVGTEITDQWLQPLRSGVKRSFEVFWGIDRLE